MAKKYRNNNIHGVINVYKEKGFTSHDVVAIITKYTGAKAGHTGTLDPDAEGVLPVCLGKATRLADYIMADEKQYKAEVVLGITTDTQDSTGEILERNNVTCDYDAIKAAVDSFLGEYMQMPPMYSAIKIGGQKLYDLARKGKDIERPKRLVCISQIDVVSFSAPDRFEIDVTCSKGTYIRALCSDIGEKLGCGAHMGSLLRTRTGVFDIVDAIKLSDIKEIVEQDKLNNIILPFQSILSDYKKVIVSQQAHKYLYNGNKIAASYADRSDLITGEENIAVYDHEGNIVGVYKTIDDQGELFLKPVTMLI